MESEGKSEERKGISGRMGGKIVGEAVPREGLGEEKGCLGGVRFSRRR